MKIKTFALSLTLALMGSHIASAHEYDEAKLSLEVIGQQQTGVFDEGAAEIVAYSLRTQRVFKVNANSATVEALDVSNPANPTVAGTIDASQFGKSANSIATYYNWVAVAIEAENKQANGTVVVYNAKTLSVLKTFEVGALPDMLKFTPNGKYLLVANEGEPNDDYTVDPEGSISVINLADGLERATVSTADFNRFDQRKRRLVRRGVRIFGPNASVSQDLEPEYIAIGPKSKRAWVSLQEANTLAVVDIEAAEVVKLLPLGTKNHAAYGFEFDASNKDDAINITNWPTKGMYMPDSIESYTFDGKPYIITANEGDSRDYDGYSEETRVKDLTLDPEAFPNADELQADENLGRLKTTTVNGDIDGDGDFDEIYSYGARSFSIWSANGQLVFDSGADFEKITAMADPDNFNSTNDENDSFDNRSDDKGPEPEGLAIGNIDGHTYAFIGLERVGGIMVYDITNPYHVEYVNYINNRNFTVDAQLEDGSTHPEVGDLAPEDLVFVPAGRSPSGEPLLVVGNEVSGTTTIYQVNVNY